MEGMELTERKIPEINGPLQSKVGDMRGRGSYDNYREAVSSNAVIR